MGKTAEMFNDDNSIIRQRLSFVYILKISRHVDRLKEQEILICCGFKHRRLSLELNFHRTSESWTDLNIENNGEPNQTELAVMQSFLETNKSHRNVK